MDIYISQLDETKNILPILKKYNIGLEVVQFASPFILEESEKYIDTYKEEIKDVINSTEISVHGPFADLVTGSRDKAIVKITKERFQQAYYVAKKLNAKKIIFHHGYMPRTYSYEEWMRNSIAFWKEFMKDKLDDIQIHIENVFEDDCTMLKELIDEINHPNFSVCLDIGHVNAYSKTSIKDWIEGLGERICHFHIHNNFSIRDSHSGINNGNLDVLEIFNLMKINSPKASISLEVLDTNELRESLEFLKEKNFLNTRNLY